MIAAQRVERNKNIPLPEAYSSCLGIRTIDSYLYFFYPNTIRVYEQFPQRTIPEICKEFIISQGKIILFAISEQYIAILYEDSKIEVRFREYWQKVQYSFNLPQQITKIDSMFILRDKVTFKFLKGNQQKYTYGFIASNKKQMNSQVQLSYWTEPLQFQEVLLSNDIGSFECFYFGLIKNQIRYGMYYLAQNQILKQFQFGKIKNQRPSNKTHTFCLIKLQKSQQKSDQSNGESNVEMLNVITLVKIQSSLKQNSQGNDGNKLLIDYRKFYSNANLNISVDGQNSQEIDSEKKRVKLYQNMVSTFSQFNKNQIIKQDTKNLLSQQQLKQKQNVFEEQVVQENNNQKKIIIQLEKAQEYQSCLQKQNFLYISTNKRIFSFIFSIKSKDIVASYSQVCRLSKGNKLIQACQDKIYLSVQSICILSQNGNGQDPNILKAKQSNQQSIQTQDFTDVLLDQIQQKQLTKMIDNLLQKRDVVDIQVQTQFVDESHNQQPIMGQPVNKSQINDKQDKEQHKIPIKQSSQKSIGQNLPLCPDSHRESLDKINKNIIQFSSFQSKSFQRFQQLLKRQQQKSKIQILKKIQQIINTTLNNSVIPLLQVKIQQIFSAKLQEVNGYIYTLALNNLLQLKQEIQKDEAAENMIRTQLIKKQIHEIAESKKAIAYMVEVCKKRQIQKLVFFQEVKKKFYDIQNKVNNLQQKVRTLIDGQQTAESKIFDQIELIKSMLRNQGRNSQQIIPTRKKSTVSRAKTVTKEVLKQDQEWQSQIDQQDNQQKSRFRQQNLTDSEAEDQECFQYQSQLDEMSQSSLQIPFQTKKRNQILLAQDISRSNLRPYPQMNPYYQNTAYPPYHQPYIQQPPMYYNPYHQTPPNYGYGPPLSFFNSQTPQLSHYPLSSEIRNISGTGPLPRMVVQRGQMKEKQHKKRQKRMSPKQKTKTSLKRTTLTKNQN